MPQSYKPQQEQTPKARFMLITKILGYDSAQKAGRVLGKPFGWQGRSQVRVEGQFDSPPISGHAMKVVGILEREDRVFNNGEPVLSATGERLYSLVIKNAKVEGLGAPEKLQGQVTRVFACNEGDALRAASSIALVQPVGSQYVRKVFANHALHIGDFFEATGVTDRVPAYRFANGKAVEPIVTKDGTQVYHYDFHASEVSVRHDVQPFTGEVVSVLRERGERQGLCVTKLQIPNFNNNRPVTCYLNLKEDERLEPGDHLSITGYCVQKTVRERDGTIVYNFDRTPKTQLVLQAEEHRITPKVVEVERAAVAELKMQNMVEELSVKMGTRYADSLAPAPQVTCTPC